MTADPYEYFAARTDAKTRAQIDRFWAHFSANADGIDACFSSGMQDMSTDPTEIMNGLAEIDADLMWEFGPAENGHRLAITAEWRDELIPLARAVVNAAPGFKRFTIMDTRPATTDFEHFEQNFEARFRQPLTLVSATCEVWHTGRIATHFTGTGYEKDLEAQALALIPDILGEETDRLWIGPVNVTAQKSGPLARFLGRKPEPKGTIDPKRFADEFRAAIAQARAGQPALSYEQMPLHERETILFRAAGRPAGLPRADLITYAASHEPLANAILRGGPFSSATHSAHGECFVGLTIERNEAHPFDTTDDRGNVEEHVHRALAAAKSGGYAGSGHGHERVYIDFALTDIETGLTAIALALQDLGMLEAASLQFLELGLKDRPVALSDHLPKRAS